MFGTKSRFASVSDKIMFDIQDNAISENTKGVSILDNTGTIIVENDLFSLRTILDDSFFKHMPL